MFRIVIRVIYAKNILFRITILYEHVDLCIALCNSGQEELHIYTTPLQTYFKLAPSFGQPYHEMRR